MNESDHYGPDADPELTAPDDEDDEAARAHQEELEARQWQDQLSQDPGYAQWLFELERIACQERIGQ